ncbi:MAG: C2H2-type zinc finger protein [Thermoplasmata archaeon]
MPYIEYDEVEAICPDCGRMFRSEEALLAHRDESHGGRDEPATRPIAAAALVCPVCHHSADSEPELRAHLARLHPGA